MDNNNRTLVDAPADAWPQAWDRLLAETAVMPPPTFATDVAARYASAMSRRRLRAGALIFAMWSVLLIAAVLLFLARPAQVITASVWLARSIANIAWAAFQIWQTGPFAAVFGVAFLWMATLGCAGLLWRVLRRADSDEIFLQRLRTRG
jgi:hypothetical protein